jgi:hypothetical protein
MPKKAEPQSQIKKPKSFYAVNPWECRHHQNYSEIIAYVEASGTWEIIANIRQTSGASAETMASFICKIVNENQERQRLLLDAMNALQTCLDEDDLTFSSEQAADRVVNSIRQVVK